MTEPTWRPLLRGPKSTVTAVLHSPAFDASRERAAAIIGDPTALRALADVVRSMDLDDAPLSSIADRVIAATRLLHAKADALDGVALGPRHLDSVTSQGNPDTPSTPGRTARERLVVAALHYLITPVDLVPDFRAGGYLDDVILLSWVFGAAVNEIEPFLDEPVENSEVPTTGRSV